MFQSSNYADGLEIRIAELQAENAELREQLAEMTASRDDYLARFRDLEHELGITRGQLIAMQMRAEAAEVQS